MTCKHYIYGMCTCRKEEVSLNFNDVCLGKPSNRGTNAETNCTGYDKDE